MQFIAIFLLCLLATVTALPTWNDDVAIGEAGWDNVEGGALDEQTRVKRQWGGRRGYYGGRGGGWGRGGGGRGYYGGGRGGGFGRGRGWGRGWGRK